MLEDEAEDGELYQHGNEHDEGWGNEVVYAHPEEKVEEYDVKEEVERMAAREADEALP